MIRPDRPTLTHGRELAIETIGNLERVIEEAESALARAKRQLVILEAA
jgi:hypothetical protein